MKKGIIFFKFSAVVCLLCLWSGNLAANEVINKTAAKVIVREHPRTGRPYTVITDDPARPGPFEKLPVRTRMRPDYRMLDPKIKSGQVPYQGPVSDRKKVYVFAGSIATLGAVSGAAVIAAAPAATGIGASTGAGAYAVAGTGVAAGTVSSAWLRTRPDPEKDKIVHGFESRQIRVNEESGK